MPMNIEDADIANAERDADPVRFHDYDPSNRFELAYERLHPRNAPTRTRTTGSIGQQEVETQQQALPSQHGAREPVEEVEAPLEREESLASLDTVPTASVAGGSARPPHRQRPSTLSRSSTRIEAEFMHYLDRHPTAIKRVQDHRLQHSLTVGSSAARASALDETRLPSFGGGKPYPAPLPDREEYVVEFDGHEDPRHAQNWPLRTKLLISAILVFDSLAATFASSIFSAASTYVGAEFHVGREVTTLGTSLFVLGYACGPVVFAPISELYGRRIPVILTAFAFGIFNIGVAVAKDLQTVMICRFFGGFFGSAPLAIVAAVFADMYNNTYRGLAVAIFSGTIINGPLMAPFIGGFIAKSYLGWRWTAYIPAFMGFAAGTLALFFQEESYGPVILVSKAAELRRLTRNWGIHAKQEEVEVNLRELAVKNISRPFRILFTEPIVLMITVYMSFIYGLLYLSLTAFGIVFGTVYGFAPGVSGLPYFGMIVGVFIGLIVIVIENPRYARKLKANNNVPVPEWRLPITMVGGISFAIGLFWFGWTGYTSDIPWIVPTLAGLCLGFGIYTVFLQCLNYIIDSYLMFAASAIAANTIMRSLFGAIFPLFGYYMFEGIGINWGMTLLGCFAAICSVFPFIFYFFGKKIRAKSKFAPAPDIEQDRRRDEESRGDDSTEASSPDEKKEE